MVLLQKKKKPNRSDKPRVFLSNSAISHISTGILNISYATALFTERAKYIRSFQFSAFRLCPRPSSDPHTYGTRRSGALFADLFAFHKRNRFLRKRSRMYRRHQRLS